MATRVRFALTLLLIDALCVLLVGAAVTLGTQLPHPNNHILMPYPDCSLPCLLHITAGETRGTTARGALAMLADFPIDQTGAIWSFQLPDDQGNPINGVLISGEDDTVEHLRLYTRRWQGLGVTLGDLMQAGRMHPTQVYRSCSGTLPVRMLLTFEGDPQVSFAAIIDQRVSPFAPVSLISVSASDDYFPQTLATVFGSGCYIPSAWRGFASVWRYGAQPPF